MAHEFGREREGEYYFEQERISALETRLGAVRESFQAAYQAWIATVRLKAAREEQQMCWSEAQGRLEAYRDELLACRRQAGTDEEQHYLRRLESELAMSWQTLRRYAVGDTAERKPAHNPLSIESQLAELETEYRKIQESRDVQVTGDASLRERSEAYRRFRNQVRILSAQSADLVGQAKGDPELMRRAQRVFARTQEFSELTDAKAGQQARWQAVTPDFLHHKLEKRGTGLFDDMVAESDEAPRTFGSRDALRTIRSLEWNDGFSALEKLPPN